MFGTGLLPQSFVVQHSLQWFLIYCEWLTDNIHVVNFAHIISMRTHSVVSVSSLPPRIECAAYLVRVSHLISVLWNAHGMKKWQNGSLKTLSTLVSSFCLVASFSLSWAYISLCAFVNAASTCHGNVPLANVQNGAYVKNLRLSSHHHHLRIQTIPYPQLQ